MLFITNQGILFFLEDLLLDIFVSRKRNIIFPNRFLHHLPIFLHLIQDLVMLPQSIAGQTGEVTVKAIAATLGALKGISAFMLFVGMLASLVNRIVTCKGVAKF